MSLVLGSFSINARRRRIGAKRVAKIERFRKHQMGINIGSRHLGDAVVLIARGAGFIGSMLNSHDWRVLQHF